MQEMDVQSDIADDFDPWTPSGADRLLAGDALADAVRAHARTLAALTDSRDIQAVFVASDVLLPVVLAYADAQFSFTGNGQMTGLMAVGAITVVHAHEDLLRGDPDEWPAEPFAIDAPVLYAQSDVYGC